MGTILQRRRYWEWILLVDIEFFQNLKTIEEICRVYQLQPDKVREYVSKHLGMMPQNVYFSIASQSKITQDIEQISLDLNYHRYWVKRALEIYKFKSTYLPKVVEFKLTSKQ